MTGVIAVDLDGDKLICRFNYDARLVQRFKELPSAKFVGGDKGGPYWTLQADIDTAKLMKQKFGDQMRITQAVKVWGNKVNKKNNRLKSLSSAQDADLKHLQTVLPDLYEFISSRPYQKADIAFQAAIPSSANANEPGTGKTVELIGAVFESRSDEGPQLVCAPVTSLESVWEEHLLKWQDHPVITCLGGRGSKLRELADAQAMADGGEPFWLLVNPAMIGYRRKNRGDKRTTLDNLVAPFPQLFGIQWNNFIIDEFHKMGLSNTSSLSYKAFKKINADRKMATSGTPMGGRPIKLFGVLQFLYPDIFTSKWDFAKKWLTTTPNVDQYGNEHGISIEGIRPEREDEFYEMLSRYLVRRTKAEVTPWLPAKQHVTLWAHMEGEQERQYNAFADKAEVKIAEDELSATSILAEYTYLRQMAGAACRVEWVNVGMEEDEHGISRMKQRMALHPTEASCKLPVLMDKLSELGLDPDDMDGKAQVLIFSQFTRMVKMVFGYLKAKGIPCEMLTGETPVQDRTILIRRFQDPDDPLRVLVMNTMAGGTAITLISVELRP